MAVCCRSKSSGHGLNLQPIGCAPYRVCDVQGRCSLDYISVMPLCFTYYTHRCVVMGCALGLLKASARDSREIGEFCVVCSL